MTDTTAIAMGDLLAALAAITAAPAALASPPPGGGAPNLPAGGGKGRASNTNVNASNSAANNQSNTGSVNQAPIGGINQNTQVNYQGANDIGFGGGIMCRTPALYVAGFGNGASGSGFSASNFGGVAGVSIPLGQANGNCLELSREVLVQRQLDTCLTLLKAGVDFDTSIWPELERCRGLYAAAPPAPAPAPAPPPAPAPQVQQRVPVRGLW